MKPKGKSPVTGGLQTVFPITGFQTQKTKGGAVALFRMPPGREKVLDHLGSG
jgi:hypothetical protein